MSNLDFIMDYESGQCSEEEVVEGFQQLIDSGLAWSLQGSYGSGSDGLNSIRTLHTMIGSGSRKTIDSIIREGVRVAPRILTKEEGRKITACARRRGLISKKNSYRRNFYA